MSDVADRTETLDDEVLYAVDGYVATLTLNRPARMNTISRAMLSQLSARLLEADRTRRCGW